MRRSAWLFALGAVAWAHGTFAAGATTPLTPSADQAASAAPARAREKRFVVSGSIGPGLFFSQSGASGDTRRYTGTTLSLALQVGAHVVPNFAFGAAYLREQVYDLAVTDSAPSATSPSVADLFFNLNTLAVFGDYTLPLALPVLHVEGYVGYAIFGVSGRSSSADGVATPSGALFCGAVRGELPWSSPLRLGLTARVSWAPLNVNERLGTHVNVVVPALLLTVGYD